MESIRLEEEEEREEGRREKQRSIRVQEQRRGKEREGERNKSPLSPGKENFALVPLSGTKVNRGLKTTRSLQHCKSTNDGTAQWAQSPPVQAPARETNPGHQPGPKSCKKASN